MLKDDEILDALNNAPLAMGPQAFVLAVGRAVEALVLERMAAQKGESVQAYVYTRCPAGLLDRVKAAEQRVRDNRAPRSIPADPSSDVDLVLAEVRYLIEGAWPPFWIKGAHGVGACDSNQEKNHG